MSLKDLPNMTAQQVFDIVATHLLTQMKRSLSFNDMCMYRGSNGLKCAAGALIDDDEYSKNMEHRSWEQLAHNCQVPLDHFKLIKELQCIHDNSSPEFWYEALVKTAQDHGLKMTCGINRVDRAPDAQGGVMKFGGQPTPWSDEQIDGLRCRTVAQMLIEEIGADGPESAEDAAKRAVAVIQRQRARIASLEAERAERDAQEPVAWVLFDDIFIAPKDMPDDPPNLECMKPLYARPLAIREPTEEECREIAGKFLCAVANAARGVRTGRAMFNAIREVMTK